MPYRRLTDYDLSEKTLLLRIDINVPMQDDRVVDDTRIRAALPTIQNTIAAGARVVLLAHRGRPKHKDQDLSLRPLAPALAQVLHCDVGFAEDCIGECAQKAIDKTPFGGVVLLENVRFHNGETKNDQGFARALAGLGDIYCNDAFSACHRAHASVAALAGLLPNCAGESLHAEVSTLERVLHTPSPPVTAVIGGAKVSTKLDLLNNLSDKVDVLLIGGAMANTFLRAKGFATGRSLVEEPMLNTARDLMAEIDKKQCTLYLPLDVHTGHTMQPNIDFGVYAADACPDEAMILDIGEKTVATFKALIKQSKTVLCNGPMGAFEIAPFAKGSVNLLRSIGELTATHNLISVAGGGDTIAVLNQAGWDVTAAFTHVSTAGGAFLEWMEGKTLPGLHALQK